MRRPILFLLILVIAFIIYLLFDPGGASTLDELQTVALILITAYILVREIEE